MTKKRRFLVDNDMVVFAFRYALGRQTAAVSTVVEHLTCLWPRLDKFDREQIKKHIALAIRSGEAGAHCDVTEWQKILDLGRGKPPWLV
jgi:hypothetical protein